MRVDERFLNEDRSGVEIERDERRKTRQVTENKEPNRQKDIIEIFRQKRGKLNATQTTRFQTERKFLNQKSILQ